MSQKTSDILQQLEEGVKALLDSDNYKTYLSFLASFHAYSFRNSLLIHIQCKQRGITPTLCAPYRVWQQKHRHVRRGEHGIAVIAPHTYKSRKNGEGDEKDRLGFHVAYTYDVSQTDPDDDEGEVPEICHTLTGNLEDNALLDTLVSVSPVPVIFKKVEGGANGYYSPADCEIVVDDTNSQTQQAKTLLHEIAHCRHRMIDTNAFEACPCSDKEVIAESASFVVCSYLSIPTDSYSFGYLAGWGDKNLKELKTHLGLIHRISDEIIRDIEAKMRLNGEIAV